ncbi:MAG: glycosyltransferase family 4 protein [Candidatus Melainabacteria bacterium]|nr:glycosyltransferase family 4 protein [Candidatus Melainabacteria bacterium]
MKIAVASASFPASLTDDPVFPASFELVKGLHEAGNELLVVTFCDPRDPDDVEREVSLDGIRVFRRKQDLSRYSTFQGLSRMPVFSWQAARARDLFCSTQGILDDFAPDVLEVQDFNGLGFFYAAQRKIPLVVRAYGPMSLLVRSKQIGDVPTADAELIEAMEYATVAAADGVVAICHDIARWWSERANRPLDEIDIIRTPMTVPEIAPEKKNENGKKFPVIFFWGRVERQKGADLLVESLPAIVREYPDTRLLIGGQETIEYGKTEPYADTMRRRLAELGLTNHAEFLGFLSRERIVELVVEADVCVFPSRYETACYSCIEAMSYGGFCVGTRVGGLQEYLEHEKSGWIVEPEDPEALARGIVHVLKHPELREEIRKRAPEHVREFCSKKESATKSIQAYERAIGRFHTERTSGAFSIFADHFGKALQDLPSRQTDRGIQSLSEEMDQKSYQSGWEAGYQASASERSMSLGGALYAMARRIKASIIAK